MSQSGLHGIIGLYGSRFLRSRDDISSAKFTGPAAFGFVLGNIIPDADFFALGVTFMFNSTLARSMHRSFTHSLITIAAVTLIGRLAAKTESAKALATGLGAGMLCHVFFDILTWFSGVDLLWPLGLFGLPSAVNLWANFKVPAVVSNLLGAADYLCFGLFYVYLGSVSRRYGTDSGFIPRLRKITLVQWIFTVIFVVLSFVLSGPLFEIAHYALFILVFFPIALHVTFKMRATIEALASTRELAA